jgi:acetyl esterase/lipase
MTRRFIKRNLAMVFIVLFLGHIAVAQKITPDIVYGHKHGLAMTYDVFQPSDESNGVGILFMVSGGWYSRWVPPAQLTGLFQPLLDRGFTVFAVRHGSSPKFSIPEAVSDVRRAVRFIRQHAKDYHVDPNRLGVFGLSAGGHLSLMLGTAADSGKADAADPTERESSRVAAVVAVVAPSDLRIMVWNAPEHLPAYKNFPALDLELEKARECSPIAHVTDDDAPTLLIAGDKDELVPVSHSKNIFEAFKEKGVVAELMVVKGAGHGFEGDDQTRAFAALVDWFEEQLVKK